MKNFFQGIGAWFNGLSPRIKNAIFIILFLILIFIAYKIYKHFQAKEEKKNLQTTVDKADDELKNILHTQSPNYPDSTYSGWANQIEGLVTGCDFDTNTTDILSIFSNLKNDADYLKLVRAFGVRTIDNCGWWTGEYNADLPKLFREETMTGIAEAVNIYFAKQGIKSRI